MKDIFHQSGKLLMKYLLCRPRGGLNDTLCQIEKCWQYAETHNRILIIDTEYLVAGGIGIEFSKLFCLIQCNQSIHLKLTPTLLENLNSLSTYPHSCSGRLNLYKVRYDAGCRNYKDTDNGIQLTFNFNEIYTEELLIHDQCGGGLIGTNCLARLRLTDKFKQDVLNLLTPLIEKKYLAIMIRNTDYKTDYKPIFNEIYEKSINQRLLICSDSIEVQNYAKIFFDKSELITLGIPPDTGGMGLASFARLHCNDGQRYELMVKAVADLMGMANATESIFTRLTSNRFSGFALLAGSLRKNPSVVNQLLTS